MRTGKLLAILTFVVLSCAVGSAQERFQEGPLKGFTKSSLESWTVEYANPFKVQSIRGQVFDRTSYPLPEVTFEVRGPGKSEKIKGTVTDKNGRFKIKRVAEGRYKFKATKDGFRSVVGTIIVDKQAQRDAAIKIELPLGQ